MVATTGFSAGIETNSTQLSYGVEAAWGTTPAVAFQAIRYTSETLNLTKTRQRPSEINTSREVQGGVTTQQAASGSIAYALSATTYDDFFSIVMQNDLQTPVVIAGVAGDIVLTNTSGTITLTTATGGKFTNITALSWIRLLGFTNAANNNLWFVSIKTSATNLTLVGPQVGVTETPTTTLAQIRASTLKNGTTFKSLFLQQQFSSILYLTYPGAYVSRMTIQGGIGNFMTGSIDVVAKNEVKAVTNQSTGGVVAAPTGRVLDPVGGWLQATWNEALFPAAVDQFSITMENTGATAEFGLGSVAAQGILSGTFMASASFRAYFKDFTQYDLFTQETSGRLAFAVKDSTGYAYVFTFLNAVLLGQINSGGAGQAVYASFTVEGSPSTTVGAGTLIIDRLAAT